MPIQFSKSHQNHALTREIENKKKGKNTYHKF